MAVDPKTIVANYHGIEVPEAPHFGPNMIIAMQEGRYEGSEVKAGLAVIQPGSRILELGAGSGIVGAVIARNCKAEKVVSIEANPNLIDHIRELYDHNSLKNIDVRHGVVLSEPTPPETIDFFLKGNFLGSGLTIMKKPEKAKKVTVPVLSYAALKAEFPHNVIVMDIEGAEREFLRDADLGDVETIILEVHRNIYGREGMKEIRHIFANGGFVMDQDNSGAGVHVYRKSDGQNS